MSGQKYSVTIDVGANISSARQALSELQRLFGKNFSQSGNKQMFNLFGGLEKALDELETKSSKAITSLAQQKELDNARKKVMDFFDAIQTESKKISSLGSTDFAKRLEGLGTQLSSAAKAWSTYQTSVKAAMKEQDSLTNRKDNLTTTLENQKKALADLQKELDKYVGRNNEISKARGAETKAKNESAVAQKGFTAAKSAETRARNQYENYITTEKLIKDAQGKIDSSASKKSLGFIDSSAITIAKQYYNEIVKIQKAINNTKTNPADIPGLKKSLADKTTQYEDFLKANNLQKNALGGVDEAAASLFNKSISQKIEEAQRLYKQLETKANEVKTKQKEFDSKEKTAAGKTADVTALEGKKSEIESKIANLQNAISKTEADLKQAQTAFDDFFKAGKDTAAFDKLKENLRNLFGDDFVKDMQNTEQGLENIKQKIESIGGDKIAQAKQDLESFNNSLSNGQLANDLDKINNKFAQTGEQVLRAEQQVREIEHIKSRIQYFFGLANAINLVKRAIRSSFNTVKELDKAMAETAVVTDYTIKDMWKQLPEYTKRANQLGVTTKEAYESATLYYQQGLNTEQAAALSTETLKMARIAGLDAADATDRMTNALRGFNMELNATQAQRVDDVYSQLAAMSASNVDEISTAMTKVASLANNANMEFETTSAFLAQIIETTRESAETAGTALKTVVARFSEVKKLVDTDQLKGQDEEGQVIDVNKVSQALRTAGIDLNKYFLGEVGLDDIFMELASKWDSLTNIQQRYIATQAAGSRQQSRFIALMADYKRTQELVGAAYDSNGASEKQFEKTQDSMQSKLARLKNAWDEFAMGLANNAVLKGVVDALTTLLQIINKLTSAFGNGVGSVLKWTAAISALSGVRKLFMGGGFVDKALGTVLNGTIFGKGLFEKGILSGFLFGGKHVAGSKAQEILQEQAANGGGGTTIRTGGLFGSLFNGGLKKRIADFKKNNGWGKRIGEGKGIAGAIAKLLGGKAGITGATALAGALTTVAAAAGAVAIAYKAWYDLSPEGQLKQATKWAETMDKVSENAEKAKNSTKEAYEGYQEKNKAVETADTAISKQKAISERNQFINDLLQKDNTYAQYLKTSFDKESGQLTLSIDEADLKKVSENAEAGAIKAATGANLAQAMKAGKQANVYEAQMQRAGANIITKTIKEYTETGAVTRAMTPDEITKYQNLQLKQSQQKAAMEAYAKSAYAGMIDSKTLGSEVADLVAGLLAKTFDEDEYQKEVKKGRTQAATYEGEEGAAIWWLRGREYWKKRYQEVYGYEPEKDLSGAQLATAVGEALAQQGLEDKAASVSKLAQNSQYKTLFKALNGEVDIGLWEDTEQYINKFKDQMSTLAGEMGYDADKLANILRLNAKTEKELQKSNLATLSTKGIKAGAKAETLQTFLGENKENIAKIINFSDAAEKSLGDGFGKFLDDIPQYIKNGQLDNLGEFFKSFDLDSPISAFKKLKTISLDTKDPLQSLAKEILDINSSTFNQGYLTQVFMTSEAYEGISENLEKFIEDNKEITAENINELAESCNDLKILIDETGISAQSLARAFTAVGTGKVGIEGITSSVLEALGATKTTTTAIDSLFKSIDEFDAGRDFGKAVDFANEKVDTLRKSLETLDFGNETFKKNYQYFFNDYEKFIKLDTASRKSLLTQNLDRMEQLLDNDAVGAMRELATKGIGVSQLDKEGFTFNWDVQGDWEDTVAQVADALDVNTQMAETIVAAAAKHIPGLLDQMDVAGYQKTLHSFAEATKNDTVITTQELEALAAATGKKVEELRQDFKNAGLKLPIEVSWQDENGKNLSGDDLIKRFRETEGAIHNIMKDFVGGGTQTGGRIDLDTILNKLQGEYKLSQAQATEIANNIVQSVNGKFTKSIQVPVEITDESGKGTGQWEIKKIQVSADTVEGLEAEIKLKEDQAQWTQMGQAMANAIAAGLGNGIDIPTEFTAPTNTDVADGVSIPAKGIPTYFIPPTGGGTSDGDSSGSTATGGYVSYANGSRKIKPGVALTGEEGPELVWNKEGGYAYLVGKHGPEFANLVPGDQVFPADETKSIFKRGITPSLARGGKVVPAYAEGSWDDNNDDDKKKKKKKKKETEGEKLDLDKYYNLVEDINELLRLRNLLEKDYEQLLKTEGKTGKQIYDNLTRQLNLLEKRRKIVEDLAQKRKQQILDLMKENKEYANYAWWNDEDQTIEIDWDAVQKIEDKDTAAAVKEYLSKLEDFQGKYDDMIEQLEEIESQTQEIKERGKEQYLTLENRVRDALIKQIQDKIDELTEVDKAINETNQKLFDSISQTLELQRQERTNKKTEEELSDKEKRLAYLQQDSSNANAVEIAQLQKELADARQDYTDNLIDQKISELQRQNDEAQEQRQQQIELMQQSLNWQEKSGAFWDEVYRLISEGTDATGALIHTSELANVLKGADGWDALSKEDKMKWLGELEDQVAQGFAYLSKSRQLEDLGTKEGTQISFTNAKGERLTGTVDKNGNVVVKNADGSTTTYKDVFQDYYGNYRTFEGEGETQEPEKTPETPEKETYKYEKYSSKKHWKIKFVEGKEEEKTKEKHTFKDNVCTKCGYKKKKKSGKSGNNETTTVQGGDNGDTYEDGYERPGGTHETYIDKDGNTHHIYKDADGNIYYSYVEKAGQESTTTTGTQTPDRYDTDPHRPEEHPDDYTAPEKPQTPDKDDHVHEPDPGSDFWKPGEKKWYWTSTQHWQEWIATNTRTGLERQQQSQKESHNFIETDKYKQCNKCGYKQLKPQQPVGPPPERTPEKPQTPQPPPSPQKPQGTPRPPSSGNTSGSTTGGGGTTRSIAGDTGIRNFTAFSPDEVLSSRNSDAFMYLTDVYSNASKSGLAGAMNGGSNYYDIKVQVDSLGSDYDVDKAIDRIKTRIAQENAYRNVNALSRLR